MQFSTPITLSAAAFSLTFTSRVVLLGSCFADEVGKRLCDSLAPGAVAVNPCGVLYNPESVAQCIGLLMSEGAERERLVRNSLFEARDGRWHSWLFGTRVTGISPEECLAHCLEALSACLLTEAQLLVITLGTDHCYRLCDDGRVVANCHKEPVARFVETVTDGLATLRPVIDELHARCPQLQVLCTVSPYRYAKYGFHESQLSKARLLLAVDALCKERSWVSYFPAYEIVLDELRDYRYYAADMLHPSEQAVDYIYERFRAWCFTPALQQYAAERQKALKRERHISHQ